MAKVFDNGIIIATGFRLDDPRPLDDKDIVSTFNDLLTLENAYEGITVKVQDEDYASYTWITGAQNIAGNWTMSTGGGGVDPTAIHYNIANEYENALIKNSVEALDRILIEDSGDVNNKKYINARNWGLFQALSTHTATVEGQTVSFDITQGARQIDISGAVVNMTVSVSASINATDVTLCHVLINNQRSEDVNITLNNVDSFETGLTTPLVVNSGFVQLIFTYFNGDIIARRASSTDGGDADSLQGLVASQFLRSDQDDTTTGQLTIASNSNEQLRLGFGASVDAPEFGLYSSATHLFSIQHNTDTDRTVFFNQRTDASLQLRSGIDGLFYSSDAGGGVVWHNGNLEENGAVTRQRLVGFTAAASITLDWNNRNELVTTSAISITGNTSVAFANTSNAEFALIEITNTSSVNRALTFLGSVQVQDSEARWDASNDRLTLIPGIYKITLKRNGSNYTMEVSDVYS